MTDFVLQCVKDAPIEEFNQVNETFVDNVVRYAKFLRSHLSIGMFIPCGERYQNILIEPNKTRFETTKQIKDYEKLYSEAEKKVVFKGFKIETRRLSKSLSRRFLVSEDGDVLAHESEHKWVFIPFSKVEDLLVYDLEFKDEYLNEFY